METLINTDLLKISFEAGSVGSKEAVIAFTGVGFGMGGIQKEEFVRSLHQGGQLRDTYYVIDKTRSWFNSTHDEIVGFFQSRIQNQRVVTLGNSMGGFGAIHFADLIPGCDAAIAFCPQYSIHPDIVPFESRWTEYSSGINIWRHRTCLCNSKEESRKILFFGANDPLDTRHRILFEENSKSGLCMFSIAGCGHDVGAFLKQRGLLEDVISRAMDRSDPVGNVAALLRDREVVHVNVLST